MGEVAGIYKVITYCSDDMKRSAEVCKASVERFGMSATIYRDVDASFRLLNPILSERRGAGYWLWKPYILLKEMMNSKDGELIMYMDAGVEMIAPPTWMSEVKDVWLFGNMYQHDHWCKGDVMKAIYDGEYDKQVQASVIVVKVCERSKKIIKEWLTWCEMPGFIDDSPSEAENRKGFVEHRHDQAVLTCVAYKYGLTLHYWPARYNDKFDYPRQGYNDKYGVCFNHHRKRNDEWH